MNELNPGVAIETAVALAVGRGDKTFDESIIKRRLEFRSTSSGLRKLGSPIVSRLELNRIAS